MKNKHLIPYMAVFAMLLGPVTAKAQVIVSGTVLDISADTSNAIGATSSGAVVGKNNSIACLLSYAFGEKNSIGRFATGSFVFGGNDTVTLAQSLCLGYHNEVTSMGGVAIGRYLNAGGSSTTFVIGEGIDAGNKLTSTEDQCLFVGFNSTKPTLTITRSPNSTNLGVFNKTGRVAIGDVTPAAKLHIRSDVGEDAGIILAPASPSANSSFIRFRDNDHHITVNEKGGMEISSGSANALAIASANLNVTDTRLDLGRSNERKVSVVSGTLPALYSNAHKENGHYYRFTSGPSYALELGSTELLLRTATNQDPRTEITNWRDALSVKTNGAITLNGDMTLNGPTLLNGRVGVNTENTTGDYALAVDGGIITTKVHIQDVNDWQDRVFDADYPLMTLDDVEEYVAEHRHLPGIPSEAEVKAGGFDLTAMTSALLGKIEELTLYTIRQQREIDSLRDLVTVRFGYDACGNRTSRTLEFSRVDGDKGTGGAKGGASQWEASLCDSFAGVEAMLFPNPTEGGFFLAFSGEEIPNDATATLCSVDGKAIEERKVGGMTEEFDLRGKPAGVYLLRLSLSDSVKTWKIVKR